MQLIYSLLVTLLIPILWLRTFIKQIRSQKFIKYSQKGRLLERLAIYTKSYQAKNPIWIHTVSVGEFLALKPLIHDLLAKQTKLELLLTCTTLTGSEQILNHYQSNPRVTHVYLPWDHHWLMNRFFKHFKPQLGLIMETEIWPNLLLSANRYQCPIWLINARLSEKSAKGYLRFAQFSQEIINRFTKICVQNPIDGERFLQLGLAGDKMQITGNIKFDINTSNLSAHPVLQKSKLNCDDKLVIIASSTHEGEESLILNVFNDLRHKEPNLALIIVPRHPERFNQITELAETFQPLKVLRRSSIKADINEWDILIGDSMGEMMAYYQMSDIVIMGGSFIHRGGHNLLEPAALAKAIILGPSMFNFQHISELFINQNACIQINNFDQLKQELLQQLTKLLSHHELIAQLGQKAQQLTLEHQGVKDRLYHLITNAIKY